jgi:hypothetical protein
MLPLSARDLDNLRKLTAALKGLPTFGGTVTVQRHPLKIVVYHKGELAEDVAAAIAAVRSADFEVEHDSCAYSREELQREQGRLVSLAGHGAYPRLRVISIRDDGAGLDIGLSPAVMADAESRGISPRSLVPSSYVVDVYSSNPVLC